MAAVILVVTLVAGSGAADRPSVIDITLDPHGTVHWERGSRPVLRVTPRGGDGWITMARRYTGTSATVPALRAANPRLAAPMRDRAVLIPIEVLRGDLRIAVVRRLFPIDVRTMFGWQHTVLDPFSGDEESVAWLAELFSGSADRVAVVERANPELAASGLRRGHLMHIPEAILLPAFKSLPPVATPTAAATVSPRPRPTATAGVATPVARGSGPLQYGSDALGAFAVYRLRAGEALYSAVVVRFTGQLHAKQVNQTAMEIARRSAIEDVTEIPIGFPIKIPLDLLLPEYLPADDPRRVEWDAEQQELGRFLEIVKATDLRGVHVVLDAGHGGSDSGAVVGDVWEATYAYDVMCRIKANLERHTRAVVWTTVKDVRNGFSVIPSNRIGNHRERVVLTRPPYRLEDSVLGVHLRWYLTNDIVLNRIGSDVPRSKTVFLSVHADSLHPTVRGAMVYVPSRYLRPTKPFTVKRSDIRAFAEYRNHPTVRLGSEFKARVEASSRHLAENIIRGVKRNGLQVHPYEPVRDRVLRGRRSWVPAVLRYTAAQNAVLVECCNIANSEDRALMLRKDWREQFARSVVEGMASAFAN